MSEQNGTTAALPSSVAARVWYDLHGPQGPYRLAQVQAACKAAMIPPSAPYDEWCDTVSRALTLLPQPEESTREEA